MRVWQALLSVALVSSLLAPSMAAQAPSEPAPPPTSGEGTGVGLICYGLDEIGPILCWSDVMSFGFTRLSGELQVSATGLPPMSVSGSCTESGWEHEGSVRFVVHDLPCVSADASASWVVPEVPGPCHIGVAMSGSDGTFVVSIGTTGIGFCA